MRVEGGSNIFDTTDIHPESYDIAKKVMEILNINDKLEGTVRNVVDFGAFVDIGLHNDGLIHISKMSKNYIKHPSEVLKVGDIISVYVIGIDKEKEKVQLSLFKED